MARDETTKKDDPKTKTPGRGASAPTKLEGEDTQRKPRRNTTLQLGRPTGKARSGAGDRRKR